MKKFKLILFVVALATLNFSCIVDDTTGEDDLKAFAESNYLVGFNSETANISHFSDIGVVLEEFPVNLLGGQEGFAADRNITINYVIDPSSTATEGVEFDFVTNTGTLEIPVGDTFTTFPLNINTGNFDPLAPTQLILKLVDTNDSSEVSSINDTLAITFVGCQSQLDVFAYDVRTVRTDDGSNALQALQTENITFESVNNFRTATVGPYGPGNTGAGPIGGTDGFSFSDVCGEITIESQNLVNLYSNQVFGTGSVDPDTGDIEMNYTITFGSGYRTFKATYTKQ
jgi:hypothetical protein